MLDPAISVRLNLNLLRASINGVIAFGREVAVKEFVTSLHEMDKVEVALEGDSSNNESIILIRGLDESGTRIRS